MRKWQEPRKGWDDDGDDNDDDATALITARVGYLDTGRLDI